VTGAAGEESTASDADVTSATAESYSGVGPRVSAILEAAEQAAQEIRAAGDRQAAALVEQLRAEAEGDARDMRLAAESYGKRQRRDADEEAKLIVAAAEQRVRELVAEAEEQANERTAGVEGRLRALTAEIRYLEAKRSRIVDALRSISTHIDDALDDDRAREPEPAEQLPDALAPASRRDRNRLRR
jgi:hypothetical protein